MKRLVFLLILVSVTASLTGCRRGFPLFGRGNGNQCGAYQAAPPVCAPPTVSGPAYGAPMMMAPAAPGCNCGANASPMGNSYVVGSTPNTVPGMTGLQGMNGYMGDDAISSMPANSMSVMPMEMSSPGFQGESPMNAGYGMNVIGDRIVGQGEMIAPNATVKVGQK